MINYCEKMNTFLFRRSWGEAFKGLSEVQAGKLIKAIYLYTEGKPADNLGGDQTLVTLYAMITKQLNHSAHKYAKKVQRPEHEDEE